MGAQFYTGSQVVRILQILEELDQEASGSYSYCLFPLCCKCCTLEMICIFKYRFAFQSYVMKYIYSFRCEIRVYSDVVCSSSSSILSLYLIYSHPLISFSNYRYFRCLDNRRGFYVDDQRSQISVMLRYGWKFTKEL